MAKKTSRRNLLAGAVTAGIAAGSLPKAVAQAPQKPKEAKLPDVWGQDFLYPWSPPANVKRSRKLKDSEIREIKTHIIEAVNSAEEMGCQLILTLGR